MSEAPSLFMIGCGSSAQRSQQQPFASPQSMGFKAYNLLRMDQIRLPVPPAFVLGTAYCQDETSRLEAAKPDVWHAGLQALEQACDLRLGDARRPLLLSVRSGAPVSMPGMMETLLNIGLCDATVPGLIRLTGNPRLVWDAYRRLVVTYGEVVANLDPALFEAEMNAIAGGRDERELDFAELRSVTHACLSRYAQASGQAFPQDPRVQLSQAIGAVLRSWQSDKARTYRRVNQLSDVLGTAVTVQAMVFGNAGGLSGAGVGFTRDPATGMPQLWVDFLFNAQGEDVVSGRRSAHGHDEMATVLPQAWRALQDAAHLLEQHFGDMQDFEFTVQDGRLYMLQTRSGKRTPQAAARIALDLMEEGVITREMALERTAQLAVQDLMTRRVVAVNGQDLVPLAHAATASSGVAIGEMALDEQRVRARVAAGASVILVRRDAETSDMAALASSVGLLTQRGARTSHAAVVARQLGKVCLVGCSELTLDEVARTVSIGGVPFHEGDVITLDGNEGEIFEGEAQTVIEEPVDLLARLSRLNDPANAQQG